MGVDIRVAKALAVQGHDVVPLADQGLNHAADESIFRKSRSENRILVTYDMDFNTIAYWTREKTVSIILFRLQKAKYDQLIRRLEIVLSDSAEALLAGCVVVVDEKRHRVRRLPIGRAESERPPGVQEPPAVYKTGRSKPKKKKTK